MHLNNAFHKEDLAVHHSSRNQAVITTKYARGSIANLGSECAPASGFFGLSYIDGVAAAASYNNDAVAAASHDIAAVMVAFIIVPLLWLRP